MHTHTILRITRNEAGSKLTEDVATFDDTSRDVVEAEARRLSVEDLEGARYQAVLALGGVTKHTLPTDLSVADVRALAAEVADLDFFEHAPEWARQAIDSIPERRSFSEKTMKHLLAAIRCIKGTNSRMLRQIEHAEAVAAGPKFGRR